MMRGSKRRPAMCPICKLLLEDGTCPRCGYRVSKYGVRLDDEGKKARTYNGRLYDSVKESRYAERLDWMQRVGEIREWTPQPRFPLHGQDGSKVCVYVADFDVVYADGERRIIDVKSDATATAVFKLKEKLFHAEYPNLPLDVVKT